MEKAISPPIHMYTEPLELRGLTTRQVFKRELQSFHGHENNVLF